MGHNDIFIQRIRISNTQEDNLRYTIGLFILWPFLGFLLALRHFEIYGARKVVLTFFVLYGFTFIVANEGVDSRRYADALIETAERPLSEFYKLMAGVYSTETKVDIVEPFITFVISRFTDSHNVLFAAFAFVFGYYQLRTVSVLHQTYSERKTSNALLFLLFLPILLPVFQINGFRMWTAAWVFVYGVTVYCYSEKKKYALFFAAFAALIHFSFIAAGIMLLLYLFIGNRRIVWIPLAIGTFFIAEFPIDALNGNIQFLGPAFEEKVSSYTNEQYIQRVAEESGQTRWFIQWKQRSVWFFMLLSMIVTGVTLLRSKDIDKVVVSFFYVSLAFLSFSNMASLLPSGGRFQLIFLLLCCIYLVLFYCKTGGRHLNRLNIIGLGPLLLYLAVEFRAGSESLNAILFFPSPFIVGFFDLDWPVYDVLFK